MINTVLLGDCLERLDEVAKLWTSSGEAARRNIEKLVEKELEILATLQDGSAILEHLEDFYLETLTVEARKANGG